MLLPTLLLAQLFAFVGAQSLSDSQINIVKERLAESATASWELGTRSQALLELDTPSFSVFSDTPLPPSRFAPDSLSEVLDIASTVVANRSVSNNHTTGPQALIQDGAAGDPASLGVAVLIANWTGQSDQSVDYLAAAQDQLDFLLEKVPKTSDGAISHRVDQVQLWSDFVYMVPPFLAYHGMVTQNRSTLGAAYTQIQLYRNYLRDPAANNLWKHIVLGQGIQDNGHWSTGNAWAVAGMLRVLATIKRSQYANVMKREQKDLSNWIREILDGMYPHLLPSGLFNNYADNQGSFPDAASTALMAASVYRAALLTGTTTHVPLAEMSRKVLSSSTMQHFTNDGWLTPVVDPLSFGAQLNQSSTPGSPEGQAFVVEMQAAWRDWMNSHSPGINKGCRTKGLTSVAGVWCIPWAMGSALASALMLTT